MVATNQKSHSLQCKCLVPALAALCETGLLSLIFLLASLVVSEGVWASNEDFCREYWDKGGWNGRVTGRLKRHETWNSSNCEGETAAEALRIAIHQHNEYCEGMRIEAFIRQPANSWTAGIYYFAGGWSLGHAWQTRRLLSDGWPLFLAEGISITLLGIGTFFFHAAYTLWANQLDVGFMYASVDSALATTLWRCLRRWGPASRSPKTLRGFAVFLVPLFVVDIIMYELNAVGGILRLDIFFLGGFAIVILLEACLVFSQLCCKCATATFCKDLWVGLFALFLGLTGMVVRTMGVTAKEDLKGSHIDDGFCDPENPFQPHALWHVLTGIAFLLLVELQSTSLPHVVCGLGFQAWHCPPSGVCSTAELEQTTTPTTVGSKLVPGDL